MIRALIQALREALDYEPMREAIAYEEWLNS